MESAVRNGQSQLQPYCREQGMKAWGRGLLVQRLWFAEFNDK